MIEAVVGRHEVRMISEMPFPDTHGGVILLLKDLGDSDFIRIEALTSCWEEHTEILFIHMHIDPARITASHEAGARGGAYGAGRVKVSEPHPFPGHLVKDRRSVFFCPKGANVGIAKVIAEYDNDVGLPFSGQNRRSDMKEGKKKEQIDSFHE
tara:strand:+ start:2056 stop:2514 length:459 start_codon:yes stop_codon:yes gene_type:complete